jgi:hypothetical protein
MFECINDAIQRFEFLNPGDHIEISQAQPFLDKVVKLDPNAHISFYHDSVKVRINEYILDYDYEDPDMVFISSFIDGVLVVKDCQIDNIKI